MESQIRKNKVSLIHNIELRNRLVSILFYILLLVAWQLASMAIDIPLVLPTPKSTFTSLFEAIRTKSVLINLGITLQRVLKGWGIALVIGIPIGIAMGLSPLFDTVLGGFVNSIRQVPMMAWVPLSIIWLGIGDGPTLFMIALNGVFQVIMNTSAGVAGISEDYYNAAKSMGAGKLSIFFNIVLPGALPDMLMGARLAIGAGWMSVLWAEFIATSAGIGYVMIEAQSRMQTNRLLAIMIITAVVGFLIDRLIQLVNRRLTRWRWQ